MIRWIRIAAVGCALLTIVGLGVGIGLFLVANSRWVVVHVPEWLQWAFGDRPVEVWLPALLAGWLAAVVGAAAMLAWSMYYVWRRRQYEALIARLEKELAMLRNLPFTRPAPLEDLPEDRDDATIALAAAAAEADDDIRGAREDAD